MAGALHPPVKLRGYMAGSNLIENDPLVKAVFESVKNYAAEPTEKLRAVVRAGKIAEAYLSGGLALEAASKSLTVATLPE